MRTYGKKRRSPVTPFRIFADEERDNVPELRHSRSPRLVLSTPPSVDTVHDFNEETLATSPARSDASSSMKSRESALERRVSLLLRTDGPVAPAADPPRVHSSPRTFDDSLSALPMSLAIQNGQDGHGTGDKQPKYQRPSSFVTTCFFLPKKPHNGQVTLPCKPKANKLTKRTSISVHTPTATKAEPRSLDSGSSAPSSKLSPSLRDGIDAGLRALTKAKTTLIRKTGPLLQRICPDNKARTGVDALHKHPQEKATQTDDSLGGFVNSLESVVFGPPNGVRPSSGPLTNQVLPLPRSERDNANRSPTCCENISPLNRNPVVLTPDLDELVKRGTTRLRLAPSARENGHRRLSVTGATNPNLLDVPACGIIDSVKTVESVESVISSSVGSQTLGHELRRTTMRIGREPVLDGSATDCQSLANSKRPESLAKTALLKRSHDDVFTDSPQPKPKRPWACAGHVSSPGPLREIDLNKKIWGDDMGAVKTAKALRMSVSPRVKEVLNKLPRRRKSSNKTGTAAEPRLSHSYPKASRASGHPSINKEPPRLLTNPDNAIDGVCGGNMSDDELAL